MNIVYDLPPILGAKDVVAIDTESFGQTLGRLHRPEGTFASMQMAIADTVYIIQDETQVQAAWNNICGAAYVVMHNATYDLRQLRRYATIEPRPIWDTMLVERAAWNGYYMNFALKDLVRRYLGIHMDKEVREEFSSSTAMTPEMLSYAARDAQLTLRVMIEQHMTLSEVDLGVYWTYDAPLIWVVQDWQPVKVDVPAWTGFIEGHAERIAEIQEYWGVNVKSTRQVIERATKLRVMLPNTRDETLQVYADLPDDSTDTLSAVWKENFFAAVILCRRYRTEVERYGMKWIERYVEEGDLVYCNWKITGTETGRFSASDPLYRGALA